MILGSLYLQRPPQRSCNPSTDPLCLLLSEIMVQVVVPHQSSESPSCVPQSASSRLYTCSSICLSLLLQIFGQCPQHLLFLLWSSKYIVFFWFVKLLLNFDSKIGFCLTSLWMTLTSITLKFWLLALFGLEQTSLSMFTKEVEGSGSAFWVIK